jgi:uncharacterized protein YraI
LGHKAMALVFGLFLLLATPLTGLAWTGQVQGTDNSGLLLRTGIWSSVISTLPEGAQFEVLDTASDQAGDLWYQVNYNGQTGWVYSPYVAEVPSAAPASQVSSSDNVASTAAQAATENLTRSGEVRGTDGSGLYLRTGIQASVITIMPEGADFTILDSATADDGTPWYKVTFRGQEGWALGTYVCETTGTPASEQSSPAAGMSPTQGTEPIRGTAAWYGGEFQGQNMACGQPYDMYDPTTTAANIFPLGTWLRVTNVDTGQSIEVQVRDTGGFGYPMILDLSAGAFSQLADLGQGVISVEVQPLS